MGTFSPDRTNPASGNLNREDSAAPFQIGMSGSFPNVMALTHQRRWSMALKITITTSILISAPPASVDGKGATQNLRSHRESHKQGAGKRYGTGNIMAQGYHHSYFPGLERDIETELVWGIRI